MLGKFGMLLAPAARALAEASSLTGSRTSCWARDEAEHQHPQCCKHRRQDSWGCRALGAAPAGIARAHLSRPSGSGPAAHPTLLPAGTSGSVPVSLLLRSACPPALKVWSKDRKTWKELQELSLFSLSTVYINNFIRNRSLTSVFWFSKGNSCS